MSELTLYGGVQPSAIIGKDGFVTHNASESWDDQGAATELVGQIMRDAEEQVAAFIDNLRAGLSVDLAAYGAAQVRDAVVDYVSNGYMDLVVMDGKIMLSFDASNDRAQFRACWDLGFLLTRAANEALAAGDTGFYRALEGLQAALPKPQIASPPPQRTQRAAPPPQQPRSVAGKRVVTTQTHRRTP